MAFGLGLCGKCCPGGIPCGHVCVQVNDLCTTGARTGATATVTLGGSPVGTATTSGTIGFINVVNRGSGYTSAPTVTITGTGTGATATATLGTGVNAGKVLTIAVNSPGSGYTGTPTVSISGGGGSGATASAGVTVAGCIGISTAGSYVMTATDTNYSTATTTVSFAACSNNNVTLTIHPLTYSLCIYPAGCSGRATSPPPFADDSQVAGIPLTVTLAGSTVATATTDGVGKACVTVPPGLLTITASQTRYTINSTTNQSTACNAISTAPPLIPASGYVCPGFGPWANGCSIPTATSQTLSDPIYGDTTVTWNASGSAGAGWYGSKSVTIAPCAGSGCTGGTGTINYQIINHGVGALNVELNVIFTGVVGSSCVHGGLTLTIASGSTCPPSSVLQWHFTGSSTNADGYCGSSLTFSMHE